jgi:hypothetical protein
MKKIAIVLFLLGATMVDASNFVSCTRTASCTIYYNGGHTVTHTFTATSQDSSPYGCRMAQMTVNALAVNECNQVNMQ